MCYTISYMKKNFTIPVLIALIVLVVIIFALKSSIKNRPAEVPMNKVGVEDIDPVIVEECNEALTLQNFTDEKSSDEFFSNCVESKTGPSDARLADDTDGEEVVVEQNPMKFTGTLEKVDVGCFADGECYVEVGGKHVTVLMGWSRNTVGTVIGGDNSIGGLEAFIGKQVDVYAHQVDGATYTLYGDAEYFVKVI